MFSAGMPGYASAQDGSIAPLSDISYITAIPRLAAALERAQDTVGDFLIASPALTILPNWDVNNLAQIISGSADAIRGSYDLSQRLITRAVDAVVAFLPAFSTPAPQQPQLSFLTINDLSSLKRDIGKLKLALAARRPPEEIRNITERVIERIQPITEITKTVNTETKIIDAASINRIDAALADLSSRISVNASRQTATVENISVGQRIDALHNVTFTGTGNKFNLTTADIPANITASNYLPLSGGTLTGALTGTALTLSGDLTVSGAQTLSGAITIPYLNATSTIQASTFVQASSTRLSVFDKAYFGGISTTTINSLGSITLPSAALLTAPYASSTAFTASGAGYFGLGSFTNTTGTTTIAAGQGFTIGGSQFVVQQTSGNVGVGTTSPGTALGVNGVTVYGITNATSTAIGNQAIAQNLLVSGNLQAGAAFSVTGTSTVSGITNTGFITTSGNLSVGSLLTAVLLSSSQATTTTLGITGSFLANVATSTITNLTVANFSLGSALTVGNGGTGQTTFTSSQLLYGNGTSALSSVATTTPSLGTGLSYSGTLGALVGGASGSLTVATSSLYSGATGQLPYFSGANTLTATSSIFLATSGNVGIGTTSPVSKLSVVGESAFAGSASVGLGYAGTAAPANGMIIQGNVGIGTANPSAPVQISFNAGGGYLTKFTQTGSANADIRIERTGGTTAGWEFYIPSGTQDLRIFDPGNADRITFQNGGNLGIGTTSPAQLLSVAGNGYLTGGLGAGTTETVAGNITGTGRLSVTSTTATSTFSTGGLAIGTNQFVVQQTLGNVGIGTTSPMDKLSVVGNIAVTGCVRNAANGTLLTGSPACVDIAESYVAGENLFPGDLVAVQQDSSLPEGFSIVKATSASVVIGAVSSRPAVFLQGETAYFGGSHFNASSTYPKGAETPLALAGRVPVRVSLENGPVAVGDPITISSVPGVGKRATDSGRIVGFALEPFPGPVFTAQPQKNIMVFLNSTMWFPDNYFANLQSQAPSSALFSGSGFLETLKDALQKFGIMIEQGAVAVKNLVVETLTAQDITTDRLRVRKQIELQDEDTGTPYCVRIKSGALLAVPGECNAVSPSPFLPQSQESLPPPSVPSSHASSTAPVAPQDISSATSTGVLPQTSATSTEILPPASATNTGALSQSPEHNVSTSTISGAVSTTSTITPQK